MFPNLESVDCHKEVLIMIVGNDTFRDEKFSKVASQMSDQLDG